MHNKHFLKYIGGFVLLIIILFYGSFLINKKINQYENRLQELNRNYHPSLQILVLLKDKYNEAKKMITLIESSEIKNFALLNKEFSDLYQNWIFPLTKDLKIHTEKWPDDDNLIKELINLLRVDIYDIFTEMTAYFDTENSAVLNNSNNPPVTSDINDLVLLYSKIEQDFDYLINKRNLKINSFYQEAEVFSLKVKSQIWLLNIVATIFILVIVFWQIFYTNRSLKKTDKYIRDLSEGIIPENIIIDTKNEFSSMYENLNKLILYFRNNLGYIENILRKNFSSTFNPSSKYDHIGQALHTLDEKLILAKKVEEERKKDDAGRNWLIAGITKINDILRKSGDNINELSNNIIKEVVEYTDSMLGALYILNNEDPDETFLEMTSVYAYDRQKYMDKKIYPGEGLVGRCVQDNEIIYMTDIPENYLSIRSGMGETKPVSLLIVPLKLPDESVYGAIELASLKNMEDFEIKYIQTAGESVASTVAKMKINLRTYKLLEYSRQQAEEMSIQKEQMREKVNELKVIQEQYAIREEQLNQEISRLKAKIDPV